MEVKESTPTGLHRVTCLSFPTKSKVSPSESSEMSSSKEQEERDCQVGQSGLITL